MFTLFGMVFTKTKLIIGGIVIALFLALGAVVYFQNKSIDALNQKTGELTIANKSLSDTLTETNRRETALEQITAKFAPIYAQNQQVHEQNVKDIDKDVQAGKDKPVGNLLNDYFNRLQHD